MNRSKRLQIFVIFIFFLVSMVYITLADVTITERFQVVELGFIESEVTVQWERGGSYDAKTNLKDTSIDPSQWRITTVEGQNATINQQGVVQFHQEGGGTYQIQVIYTEPNACEATMTLIVSPCLEISGSIQFGAFSFSLSAPAIPNGEPDDEGFCSYDVLQAGFSFEMPHDSISIPTQQLENVHLIFKYRAHDRAFKDVTFTWTGNKSFKVSLFDAQLSQVSLTINASGALSGSVDINISLQSDVTVKQIAFLRRGVTGKIRLSYSQATSFSGVSFDFSGIDNIVIELEKNGTVILSATGSLDANGVLDATLTAVPGGVTYQTRGFEVEVPPGGCQVRFTYDIRNTEINFVSGTGNLKVKGITGINGFLDLGIQWNGDTITATVGADSASAFGMTFSNVSMEVTFDTSFNVDQFTGQLSAQHNDFDASFEGVRIEISDGRLRQFTVQTAQTRWKNFQVSFSDARYAENLGLRFDIALVIDGLGNLAIENFVIHDDGLITMDRVQGQVDQSPVDVQFSAEFAQSSFAGEFSGTFPGNIALRGATVLGVQGAGASAFTYAYLAITVGTNIPLGSSGLKIAQISGEFGYNYNASATRIQGRYEQGTHTIGLGLRISDAADLMLIGGYVRLILGAATSMELIGDVQVTASTQYFAGQMTIQYTFGSTEVNGTLRSVLHIPADGSIVSMDQADIAYAIRSNQWQASGNMSGKFFDNSDIGMRGDLNLRSTLSSPISGMQGRLNGSITASLNDTIAYPDAFNPSSCDSADDSDNWCGFGFKGRYDLDFSGGINVLLEEHGISGSFGVYVAFSGNVKVKWPCYPWGCGDDCVDNYDMSASGRLTATQTSSGQMNIRGRLQFSGGGESKDADIDVTF